ncbi:MAG: hypothetical protein GWP08_04080 [Nitrospiraceae bacterium]|nr:hypothetical protein [Nitrospiraceae bacterium]
MNTHKCLALAVLVGAVLAMGGCVRDARTTEGFALFDTATVNAPFQDAWQMTKTVLREHEYEIYTRDTRGVFVAFSPMRRNLFLVPQRVKYTVSLEAISDDATEISVESIKQVYGVSLLTYPGWHDRQMTDDGEAKAILEAVAAKAGGPGVDAIPVTQATTVGNMS